MGLSKNGFRERRVSVVERLDEKRERYRVLEMDMSKNSFRERGLWCRETRGEEREVTCPF